jgi:hypothetical protein
MAGPEAPPEALPEAPKEPGASQEEASTDPEAIEVTQAPAADVAEGDRAATGEPPTSATGGAADEPIRLEEPEPARSRRTDEDEGGSLRELFWGEE